ncbi:DUF2937 family protein [Pseudooceanicola sediminis]|uniref:DUF2937 family protein n=1 Tax=Pseudooceanicola sediminis TaxID=2211117 RepID=A0A399IXN6_9RHOB|nr:DUF2937 family protein [Pseudooceanicola sediminis]RII37938.1 DUF2937 family protein [Pseudooceanicola sediminis]
MFLRMIVLAGGIAGAAGLSQFPEFTQQYRQRLAGAVDELSVVTADFDASAAAEGLSREAALESMGSDGFIGRRHQDMARAFARLEVLRADLALLSGAGAFERVYYARHMTDREVARRALEDFEPALPVTFEGVTFAGAGFVLGAVLLSLLLGLLRMLIWPFRRSGTKRRGRGAGRGGSDRGGIGRGARQTRGGPVVETYPKVGGRSEPPLRRSAPKVRRGGEEPPLKRPR